MSVPAGLNSTSPSGFPTSFPTVNPTHAHLLRIGAQYWIDNNYAAPAVWSTDNSTYFNSAVASIILGVLVILHSFYLHRYKFKAVRIAVDICAVGTILTGIFMLLALHNDDPYYFVIFIDFGLEFIAGTMTQLPDNFIFLLGYLNSKKKKQSAWILRLTILYAVVVLYLTWIPSYTIYPFFFNCNSADYFQYFTTIGQSYIFSYGGLLYNVVFTVYFVKVLYDVNIRRAVRITKQGQLFAIKCILHFFARYTIPPCLLHHSNHDT